MTRNNTGQAFAERDGDLVPVNTARRLIGRRGHPLARQTVFTLAVRGELVVREIANRFLVARASIDAYRARHGITD